MRRLRVAMLGQRGLPATYGGIEHHVEQIGSRLVELGVELTVFSRSRYGDAASGLYRGMTVRTSPGITSRRLDALTHTASAALLAALRDYDVVHFHGLGPSALGTVNRLLRHQPIVTTIHGLDQDRTKWRPYERHLFDLIARRGVQSSTRLIVVSRELQKELHTRFHRDSTYIPNGFPDVHSPPLSPDLTGRGLSEGNFLLAVGRLVPEKGHMDLIRAFAALDDQRLHLVIAGGSSNAPAYEKDLRREAQRHPRVHMVGYVYGSALQSLYASAALFVQPSYLEGMPLTLLEAIAHRLPLVVSSLPVHLDVLNSIGLEPFSFSPGSVDELAIALRAAMERNGSLRRAAVDAEARARHLYDWDRAAQLTLDVYRSV